LDKKGKKNRQNYFGEARADFGAKMIIIKNLFGKPENAYQLCRHI
jgi:hypothetical protein